MLNYNLQRLFSDRNISNPVSYLTNNGFKRYIAYRIANNLFTSLTLPQIEKLCIIFNCTPIDLLDWKPDENTPQSVDLSLKKLIKQPVDIDLINLSREIPYEKLPEFARKIGELKNSL